MHLLAVSPFSEPGGFLSPCSPPPAIPGTGKGLLACGSWEEGPNREALALLSLQESCRSAWLLPTTVEVRCTISSPHSNFLGRLGNREEREPAVCGAHRGPTCGATGASASWLVGAAPAPCTGVSFLICLSHAACSFPCLYLRHFPMSGHILQKGALLYLPEALLQAEPHFQTPLQVPPRSLSQGQP